MQTTQSPGFSQNTGSKEQAVTIHHMRQAIEQMGLSGRCGDGREKSLEVMKGLWSCRFERGGVSMHCGTVTEQENLCNTVELPPGISFNILFAGEVKFALSGTQHTLGRQYKPVECAAYTLNRPEMLSRYLTKGQFVRKVNIFVNKTWLDSRMQIDGSQEQIQRLFEHHATVRLWKPSAVIQKLAAGLLDSSPQDSLTESLRVEGESLRLLSYCLEDLCAVCAPDEQMPGSQTSDDPAAPQSDQVPGQLPGQLPGKLPEKIRAALTTPGLSVEQIAASCNMSVSTLQRRVRAVYGMTVSEYIRSTRLEKARTAMVCDGLSIGEAAYLAGYQHTSNFIVAFKKNFSMTPAAYRKSHRSPYPDSLSG